MENLPIYISAGFIATTLLTLFFIYKVANHSKKVLAVSLAWLAITATIGLSGFYLKTSAMPPRLLFLVGPPLVLILFLFTTPKGRAFIDRFNPAYATYLHVVRVPVELVLWALFIYHYVPELMTFEGRNFDVLSGITAPLVAYLGYTKVKLGKTLLLVWNFICLGLLMNIVTNAILSAPFPFQQFAFDQPNVGVLYFPFVWLPGFIVPSVLLCHLVSIRRLMAQNSK